jgi:predicted dehydrogenase/aryl-alcohol dehydrogenase-like predicted oxidoreductase
MSGKLQWGILGAGRIAGSLAKGLAGSATGELLAVGSRSLENANAFADQYGAPRRYGSYDELLADPDVQVVYIATPHPMHAEWAIKAAEAGKHVLCEKPMTMNHAEAMAVVEAAVASDVFLMEAFMNRCHPQMAALAQLITEGAIGEVRVIQATFSFNAGDNPESRLMKNALGGGGILDVGGYCTSICRLIAGAAQGKPFVDPIQIVGLGKIGETNVDDYAIACLKFPGAIVAQVATGVQVNQENVVRIYGSQGSIVIPTPWVVAREGGDSIIMVNRQGEEPREVRISSDKPLYAYEVDAVGAHIADRQAPQITWDDTLGNMKTLDMWREAVGVVYETERPDAVPTVDRRPLTVKPNHMRYGEIAGVGKPIARLVMGVDNQKSMPHTSVMFDDYFTRGGNCFDSAFVYGGGACEKVLGQWIKNRGVREQVVILDKGAHTPNCFPEDLSTQHAISLDRLQTDYIDIYMMHRDNEDVPAGEFIDVLNRHLRAGTMRAFGGSNWSIARIEEANAYAARTGQIGFAAVSNNFSLARMVDPVWAGCIHASDAESRAWFTETQMPLMPWSSQARGFFVRANEADRTDKELVRCWYSDDNFARLARVQQMAAEKSLLPITLALAYILNQPFPTFPLIGPRALAETRTSFDALTVTLTLDELAWLNLEA